MVRFQAVVGGEQALEPGAIPFLQVPPQTMLALGSGKRPKVVVTLNGHTFRSTVAVYGGRYFLPLNQANRAASGLDLGSRVEVGLEVDKGPREVELPDALASALEARPGARQAFDRLSYTRRKEHAEAVSSAKQEATAERRIRRILGGLRG